MALRESEAARFKGLITPAIRCCAAGTLPLTPHSQYPQAERGRERERMMDGGRVGKRERLREWEDDEDVRKGWKWRAR